MARSGEIYGGAWGRTRTESLHVSCPCGQIFAAEVHRAVNATRDPALAAKLAAGSLLQVRCPACAAQTTVEVPLVLHDENRRQMTLVLPTSMRHRELEERAELLLCLARDKGFAVPAYARDFRVVFGREELAQRDAQAPAAAASSVDIPVPVALAAPIPMPVIAEKSDSGLDEKVLFGDLGEAGGAAAGGAIHTVVEDSTNRFALGEGQEGSRARGLPPKDAAIARWQATRAPAGFNVDHGEMRVFARGRPAGGTLQVRVVLHRLPTYPLIVLALGPGGLGDESGEPLSTPFDIDRAEDRQALGQLAASFHLVVDFFDEAYEPVARREVILPLAANVRHALTLADDHLNQVPAGRRSFDAAVTAFRVPTFDRWGRRETRLEEDSYSVLHTPSAAQKALSVVAGWSEPDNEDYLLCRRCFPLEWWRRIRARVIHRSVELGLVLPGMLPEVAISDGLFRTRKELVTRTLSAFAEMIGSGGRNDLEPEQVAANWRTLFILCDEEGVAVDARVLELSRGGQAQPVRPPLVVVQPREKDGGPSLSELVAQASSLPHGAPARAVVRPAGASTRGALDQTGRIAVPLGESSAPRRVSVELPVVAPAPTGKRDHRAKRVEELIEMLEDKDLRLGAALELTRRLDPQSVGPVFGALRRMARAEAVRLIPTIVKYGERAVPHLVDGLRSGKAYLRQGSALALGILKSGDGIEPLCDLLLSEPTEVWREVARALGEVGGGAVMTLGARLRDAGIEPDSRERIAWAMAHVCVKGARAQVEALASGRDAAVAGVARRAIELAAQARDNDDEVRGPLAPHDQTVNRAFSRRFFEALGVAPPRPDRGDESSGSLALDDDEILEADEEMIEDEDILPS